MFYISLLLVAFILQSFIAQNRLQDQEPVRSKGSAYTFQNDVLPILQSNCNPCHFPGGKVYVKLPFDDYKTVAHLGKKLSTRLKQRQHQAIISAWIESRTKEH